MRGPANVAAEKESSERAREFMSGGKLSKDGKLS